MQIMLLVCIKNFIQKWEVVPYDPLLPLEFQNVFFFKYHQLQTPENIRNNIQEPRFKHFVVWSERGHTYQPQIHTLIIIQLYIIFCYSPPCPDKMKPWHAQCSYPIKFALSEEDIVLHVHVLYILYMYIGGRIRGWEAQFIAPKVWKI